MKEGEHFRPVERELDQMRALRLVGTYLPLIYITRVSVIMNSSRRALPEQEERHPYLNCVPNFKLGQSCHTREIGPKTRLHEMCLVICTVVTAWAPLSHHGATRTENSRLKKLRPAHAEGENV